MAGYSGTPLVKKLGIKENFKAAILNAPAGFTRTLDLPAGVKLNSRSPRPLDFAMLFVKSKRDLDAKFLPCAAQLAPAGMLWISWPKRASGVVTDLTDNVVRELGLAKGMVDVKVCAVDDVWSGLKFVFRVQDRAQIKNRR